MPKPKKPAGKKPKRKLTEKWRNWRAYRKEATPIKKEIRSITEDLKRRREKLASILPYLPHKPGQQTPEQIRAYNAQMPIYHKAQEEYRAYASEKGQRIAELDKQLAHLRNAYGYKVEKRSLWTGEPFDPLLHLERRSGKERRKGERVPFPYFSKETGRWEQSSKERRSGKDRRKSR